MCTAKVTFCIIALHSLTILVIFGEVRWLWCFQTIKVANNTILDITKQQFLSNSYNKQSCVDYVSLHRDGIEGAESLKVRDDADCLIVDTAIAESRNRLSTCCVTVVGDDTDLIVLMFHWIPCLSQESCTYVLRNGCGTSPFS